MYFLYFEIGSRSDTTHTNDLVEYETLEAAMKRIRELKYDHPEMIYTLIKGKEVEVDPLHEVMEVWHEAILPKEVFIVDTEFKNHTIKEYWYCKDFNEVKEILSGEKNVDGNLPGDKSQ